MRKIIAGMFISLDGVVENPPTWHFPYFNDEMGAAVGGTLGAADTVLFGRVTYDSFAGAWPDARGSRRRRRRTGQGARRRPQDRRVEPAAGVHLAELRAARRATSSRPSPR